MMKMEPQAPNLTGAGTRAKVVRRSLRDAQSQVRTPSSSGQLISTRMRSCCVRFSETPSVQSCLVVPATPNWYLDFVVHVSYLFSRAIEGCVLGRPGERLD